MIHFCAMQCKKIAKWIAYNKSTNEVFYYCDKHKKYQEKECSRHWEHFEKVK